MTDKELIGVRVPKDFHTKFESYREKHELSISDAGRRLLERGLEAELEAQQDPAQEPAASGGGLHQWLKRLNAAAYVVLLAALVLSAPALIGTHFGFGWGELASSLFWICLYGGSVAWLLALAGSYLKAYLDPATKWFADRRTPLSRRSE